MSSISRTEISNFREAGWALDRVIHKDKSITKKDIETIRKTANAINEQLKKDAFKDFMGMKTTTNRTFQQDLDDLLTLSIKPKEVSKELLTRVSAVVSTIKDIAYCVERGETPSQFLQYEKLEHSEALERDTKLRHALSTQKKEERRLRKESDDQFDMLPPIDPYEDRSEWGSDAL